MIGGTVGPPPTSREDAPADELTLTDAELAGILEREADWHFRCYGSGCVIAKAMLMAAERLGGRAVKPSGGRTE